MQKVNNLEDLYELTPTQQGILFQPQFGLRATRKGGVV